MKIQIYKLANIVYSSINEAFNFDEEIESTSDNIIDNIGSTALLKKAIELMDRNAITPKYVLNKILGVDFTKYSTLGNSKYLKNIESGAYILTEELGRHFTIYAESNLKFYYMVPTLQANEWTILSYNEALNDLDIHNIIITYTKYANEKSRISEHDFNTNFKDNLKICISPDKGIICIISEYTVRTPWGYNRTGVFLFTGLVLYTKQKTLSPTEINNRTIKWFAGILKQYGITWYVINQYKLISDKNGYPRIGAIISYENLWKNMPEPTYKSSMENGWGSTIKSDNPNVALRRNTKDNVLEYGIFYPWNILPFFKEPVKYTYMAGHKHFLSKSIDDATIQKSPELYGMVVFQLGSYGKLLYDMFKNNNYVNKKIKDEDE